MWDGCGTAGGDVRRSIASAAVALLLLASPPALAQDLFSPAPVPPGDIPILDVDPSTLPAMPPGAGSGLAAPGVADGLTRGLPSSVAPFAPADTLPSIDQLDLAPVVGTEVVASARLVEDGPPLKRGVVWRLFESEPGPDGALPLVGEAIGGTASFRVKPGVYFLHCGFGFAGTTERVEVSSGILEKSVVLNAGGLSLDATAGDDRPLPRDLVWFDVYSLEVDERGERVNVARDVRPGDIVRLPAGTYHVVSRYGQVNAQTRADLEVKAGKLSEVTLTQRAAEVTLKLVGAPGGEAIADTRWSILTPGGDEVAEGVGAFPSFVLAAGGYTVIAKHADTVYQRAFEVESGLDGEIEVVTTTDMASATAE